MKTTISPAISFRYDGKPFAEYSPEIITRVENGSSVTEYTLENLRVTTISKQYPEFDAVEWVTWFENIGRKQAGLISDLNDCDVSLPFPTQEPHRYTAFIPEFDKRTQVYSVFGTADPWRELEFAESPIRLDVGKTLSFANSGGRSSQQTAPFFNIAYQTTGVILAIGWSGQWSCNISREVDTLGIKSGIEGVSFKLLPGEKIRTSSTVLMAYDSDFIDAQNKWRRLVKRHFSLIGSEGRDDHAPFCAGIWGGMSSKAAIERIERIKEKQLPFEYIWMDAGWYGPSELESPDEFEGDWAKYTGDWRINLTHHPDGLLEVRKAIEDAGLKYLLWFEPERVVPGAPILDTHPEYFIKPENLRDYMLNLGNPEAWDYCFNTLSEYIERLNINFYRQDFNFWPLAYWRNEDTDKRRGITEIKYIMGLYRLWDSLLERFPHLLIDNCASGGRRIDIETLRRSVPLWRSDYQCPANFRPEGSQTHALGFGNWMPFSGTGSGREWGDVYRIRSCYAPGLTTNYTFSERSELIGDEACEFIKKYGEEFLRVRPYLSCDMYPLTEKSASDNVWCAVEYFDPESNSGILQAFRRPTAPYTSCSFKLRGLDPDKRYTITDADTDETVMASGDELMSEGFEAVIREKRCAKLYYIALE